MVVSSLHAITNKASAMARLVVDQVDVSFVLVFAPSAPDPVVHLCLSGLGQSDQ